MGDTGWVVHQTCPRGSQEKSTSIEVGLQEEVGSGPGHLLPICAGGQEVGISCLFSTFHPWAVGAGRWLETQGEKGAVQGSHGL